MTGRNRESTLSRGLTTGLLILLFPLLAPAGEKIRLLVPGLSLSGEGTGKSESAPWMEAAGIRPIPCPPGSLDPASLREVDAVLLDESSLEILSGWSEDSVQVLRGAIREGLGLVAVGEAISALPRSGAFSLLLGRRSPPAPAELPRGGVPSLVVEFPDQGHPVTQCLTPIILSGPPIPAEPAAGVRILARLAGVMEGERTVPARTEGLVWTRTAGRGRVLAAALRHPRVPWTQDGRRPEGNASSPGTPFAPWDLSFLVGRGVQWVSGRRITVRIPETLRLAAQYLGPGDTGVLPGLPRQDGYYRGRQIAPVMSYHGAAWLERADREATEFPERLLDSLEIPRGSTVADLGAGSGYFSVRLARRVGPGGLVLAVDIQKEMIRLLKKKMDREGLKNIRPILATPGDPRLPAGSVDLILLVDVYHELSQPQVVLAAIRKALAPGGKRGKPGRLVLVEYRGEDPRVPIKPLHRMTQAQVRAELKPLGFRWIETKSFLPYQHILIFQGAQESREG